ncbi:MAG TPA: metallopeptidase family protein [Candidatus Polarisedimenticolia bacterium]|jgi:predicted Zn-dependent protease with MMP-like domain
MGAREVRLDLGWDLLEQGEFDGAIEVASALLAEEPEDVEASFLSASARFESGDLEAAHSELRSLLAREPDDVPCRLTLAALLYETCRFEEGLLEIERVLPQDVRNPYAHHLRGLLLDMTGRHADADASFRQAADLGPDRYRAPDRIDRSAFEAIVEEALASIPAEFRQRIGNVPILLEQVPSAALLATLEEPSPDLLGLFVGTPLTQKTTQDLAGPPEAIYLFQRSLERQCETVEELVEEIRVTLLHEIGHFLGMEEEDLDEAGYA